MSFSSKVMNKVASVFLFGAFLVQGQQQPQAAPPPAAAAAQRAQSQMTPEQQEFIKQMNFLASIVEFVSQSSAQEVPLKTIFEGAVAGLLGAVDAHSSYIPADAYKKMKESHDGKFAGVGLTISGEGRYTKVISPIDNTPGARAGIQPGDYIVRIDDKSIVGLSAQEVSNKLRGQPGTPVKITLARPGTSEAMELVLVRELIEQRSAVGRKIGNDVGYIRLSDFSNKDAARQIKEEVQKLQSGAADSIKGYILDLRNNPGGLIDQGVAVSDLFMDNTEQIVSTKGRINSANRQYFAAPGDILNGKPLIVLTNNGSASASEIVAAALQDKRPHTKVLGTATFGKGSMQQVIPLGGPFPGREDAISVTVALFHRPSGPTIQGKGVQPNIEFAQVAGTDKGPDIKLSEADLQNVIANPDDPSANDVKSEGVCTPANDNPIVSESDKGLLAPSGKMDAQLGCAVETLRGGERKYTKMNPPKPQV